MNSYSTDDHTAPPAEAPAQSCLASQGVQHDPEVPLAHTLTRCCDPALSGWVLQDAIRFFGDQAD